MSLLDLLIPKPALVEIDRAELAVDAQRAWEAVHDLDLARSALVRTLFAIRTIPDRLKGATVSCVFSWTTWFPRRTNLAFRCSLKTLRTKSRLARSAKCGSR